MTYCMCEKCGNKATVDTSVVLTTYPPQYSYSCPSCGHKGYIFCSDVTDFDLADKIERLTIELNDLRREVEELQNKLAKEGINKNTFEDLDTKNLDAKKIAEEKEFKEILEKNLETIKETCVEKSQADFSFVPYIGKK